MGSKLNKQEFCALAQALVDDAFTFIDSDLGQDWTKNNVPASQFRHIRLSSRRAIGKTFTGAWLAGAYDPTMWVFNTSVYKQETVSRPWRRDYPQTNPDYAFSGEEVLSHEFFPRLGHVCHTSSNRRINLPKEFKLGIIDDSPALENRLGWRKKDEVLDRMFMCCKVVLELG
jgi:hypothetical protein